MALLKDIYDIINEIPEVKKAIGEQLIKFIQGPGVFSKKLTIEQQIEQEKLLIKAFTDPQFSEKFPEHLDYFGVLLATIGHVTYLKERGCIIRDFYCPEYVFYFPASGEEPKLIKSTGKVNGEHIRSLQVGSPGNKYVFYAIKKTESTGTLSELLDTIATSGQGNEVNQFLDKLHKSNLEHVELYGIAKDKASPRYWFKLINLWAQTELNLSSMDPSKTKQALRDDLTKILTFLRF